VCERRDGDCNGNGNGNMTNVMASKKCAYSPRGSE
jgi:hypothetical protein